MPALSFLVIEVDVKFSPVFSCIKEIAHALEICWKEDNLHPHGFDLPIARNQQFPA